MSHTVSQTSIDLSRAVFLDVMASGHVFLRERGAPCTKGGLPVFTTNTMHEAEMLRVRHCRLARDGSGLYQLNEPPVDVADLSRIAELFRESYKPKA
jgi:hypothetical protein